MGTEVRLTELFDKLGLEYTPRHKMRCPFCHHKGTTLSFNDDEGKWICPKCDPKSSGRVLHFYARYVKGMDFPSDAKERGRLSKELLEFMGHTVDQGKTFARPAPAADKPRSKGIPAAADAQLHAVYSAMAELPYLALSDQHRKALQKRGLTDAAIRNNGYRTLPEEFPDMAPYLSLYEKEGGDTTRRMIFDTWRYPAKYIQFGLKIAASLLSMGLDLQGVPGFYKFGESWCFWVNPGILIPTRNLQGQIVCWQVRQNRDPKYMTCHCTKLPGAVTVNISRCHFPMGNAPLSAEIPVIFTEGPLKADVALCLYGKPVTFAAIPGIDITEDLLRYVEDFRKAGVTVLQNGFDMDKLTNPNVIEGSERLVNELRMRGMAVRQLYWGERYAEYKLRSLLQIARCRNVSLPADFLANGTFDKLCAVSKALDAAKINACKIERNKKKVSFYWEPETKGIDDYYLSVR